MLDPTQVVTLKPRRGVKKVAVDPKRAQELLMRVADVLPQLLMFSGSSGFHAGARPHKAGSVSGVCATFHPNCQKTFLHCT